MSEATVKHQTRLLDATRVEDLATAADLLRRGGLVAVPTETVYGLAADARQPEAVAGIFRAKQRPSSHPLIVHLPDAAAMPAWARDIPASAWTLASAFWPGPLTLLLHKAPGVSDTVTGGLPTIGLRVPAHPVLLDLLRQLDTGLAAPSANPHRQLSPTSAPQVLAALEGRIDAVLDGGICALGLESTIVDLTTHPARILRAGPLGRAQIEAVLGEPVDMPLQHEAAVPGNVAVHYRPRTPLYRLDLAVLEEALRQAPPQSRLGIVTLGPRALPVTTLSGDTVTAHHIALAADPAGYASRLYSCLFTLDGDNPDAILLQAPPTTEDWLAVNDRLRRASVDRPPPWLHTA